MDADLNHQHHQQQQQPSSPLPQQQRVDSSTSTHNVSPVRGDPDSSPIDLRAVSVSVPPVSTPSPSPSAFTAAAATRNTVDISQDFSQLSFGDGEQEQEQEEDEDGQQSTYDEDGLSLGQIQRNINQNNHLYSSMVSSTASSQDYTTKWNSTTGTTTGTTPTTRTRGMSAVAGSAIGRIARSPFSGLSGTDIKFHNAPPAAATGARSSTGINNSGRGGGGGLDWRAAPVPLFATNGRRSASDIGGIGVTNRRSYDSSVGTGGGTGSSAPLQQSTDYSAGINSVRSSLQSEMGTTHSIGLFSALSAHTANSSSNLKVHSDTYAMHGNMGSTADRNTARNNMHYRK
mmetsp:Transcript_7251/g.12056  ORF Transcript_7251/g.12056 Transcript_7251/m.12056 type:complete len:344 (-) Transcript_7251:729-1760(-)